eukprot:scaffold438_cov250-Pinguiococcus_pyrenoidosus.AAC.19
MAPLGDCAEEWNAARCHFRWPREAPLLQLSERVRCPASPRSSMPRCWLRPTVPKNPDLSAGPGLPRTTPSWGRRGASALTSRPLAAGRRSSAP